MLSEIIGVVGGLCGLAALYMQWSAHRKDDAKLKVSAELKEWVTAEIREPHLNLRVVLTNHGRRPVRIRAVDLVTFPESVTIGGHSMKVRDFRLHLFKSDKEGLMVLEENDRKEIEIEPLDTINVRNIEAVIEVIDALEGRHHYRLPYEKEKKEPNQ